MTVSRAYLPETIFQAIVVEVIIMRIVLNWALPMSESSQAQPGSNDICGGHLDRAPDHESLVGAD